MTTPGTEVERPAKAGSSDAFGLITRADDPLTERKRVTWDEVSEMSLITNPLCERIEVPDLQDTILAARLRVHNTTTLIGMVRAGLGVTVLPELVTRNTPPGLAFTRLQGPVIWRELHLLLRLRDTPSPGTAAFAAFVTAWSSRRG